MKILYVDVAVSGHRIPYLTALVKDTENEVIAVLPERVEGLDCKQIVCEFDKRNRTFKQHKKWILEIQKVAMEEQPDIIHFLAGDIFYRFFGIGLNKFKKCKKIITLHFVKNSFLHKISIKVFSSFVDKIVLHSEFMKNQVESLGIKNAVHIEYPVFGGECCDRNKAKEYFGLKKDIPVIGCIGGTRYDKGLDILLEALKTVHEPFQLLVAGKDEYFKEDFIKEQVVSYRDNVYLALRFLTEDELMYAMNATNIIVLPYRKEFNGASGPLVEGVALGKCIVGPAHGNLKDTIEKNHLGYTFESEDINSLKDSIKKCLLYGFEPDINYVGYQKVLKEDFFIDAHKYLYKQIYS